MSDEKKNGRSLAYLASVAGLVLALLGIGGYVAAIAADHADTKRRVTTVEQRQTEDRQTVQRDQREIKRDVKDIGENVQVILRKLDAIEAAQRARERR